jgi:hypothetical protein
MQGLQEDGVGAIVERLEEREMFVARTRASGSFGGGCLPTTVLCLVEWYSAYSM